MISEARNMGLSASLVADLSLEELKSARFQHCLAERRRFSRDDC